MPATSPPIFNFAIGDDFVVFASDWEPMALGSQMPKGFNELKRSKAKLKLMIRVLVKRLEVGPNQTQN
jgi:hypothetical protein